MRTITAHVSRPTPPPISGDYLWGLSDYQAKDPIIDPEHQIYCEKPYFPRNWTPPNMRPPVPEVRRFKNSADDLYMTEGIEWMWLHAFWLRNPDWMPETVLDYFRRHTRTDAGFTNKVAWNSSPPRKSWVLNVAGTKPVQLLGIVCPGGNRFRSTGSKDREVGGDMCKAVWNLDYDWLVANITKENAREFALTLPDWLLHTAKIVKPVKIGEPTVGAPNGVFLVINWDGDFCVPHITSAGRQEVVDGFHVRENWFQANRLAL